MAMLTVIVAGVFETAFALLLKKSHGLTRLWPSVGFAICALASFGLLTLALKKLEVGTAYAIWTGIGAGGTAIIGMIWLGESVSPLKIAAIALILAGVICLNFAGVSDT
jgi:quaternary ammonium compound-resistance protein SugE